ncbi:MAG: glycosyltransferase [Ilumatobacteraceae bacterium]
MTSNAVTIADTRRPWHARTATATLEVVIPVYNEQEDLENCIKRLHDHLVSRVPYRSCITIADNASTDGTLLVAHRLASEIEDVHVRHLDQKGRGRALKTVWLESDADIVAYMDVDLSTDLNALVPLVASLISGHSDVAIGSRLARSSRVVRGAKRQFISRSYNLILRTSLHTKFSDAQCGFKAIRADIARELLPLVQDTGWFFDTELLVLAENVGLRIHEIPVDWIEDPDSSVNIVDTAAKDLQGCWRVGRALATGVLPVADLRRSFGREPLVPGVPIGMVGQLARFAVIGVISTIAYVNLYLLLHLVLGAHGANFAALLITAVLNLAANRAFTFGVRGSTDAAKHQMQALPIFAFGLLISSGSLLILHECVPMASMHVEAIVLVVTNLVAALGRFIALRGVFLHAPSTRLITAHTSTD